MQIQEERQGAVQIVTIDDHLDTSSATDLENRLVAMIENGERQILVDCTPLQYVNSAGLKVFLMATKKLELIGGQLMLCALSANVMIVFEMIGFTRIMKIAPTREAALRSFAGAVAS